MSWRESTDKALAELRELKDNWDSYGGKAVRPFMIETVEFVLEQIMRDDTPLPSIVPQNNGAVQLEWSIGGVDVEIEICEIEVPEGGRVHYCNVLYEDTTTAGRDLRSGSVSLANLQWLRNRLAHLTETIGSRTDEIR